MIEGGPAVPAPIVMSEKNNAPRPENHTGPSRNLKPSFTSVAGMVIEASGAP
jgi:hypothetical protein